VKLARFVASSWLLCIPFFGCASSGETDLVSAPKDAGKDAKKDAPQEGGGTGGQDAGLEAATSGGGTGGGTCNVDFCPTPAPPASKCCVTSNGPCGVDYGQGQGCTSAGSGGSGP
jgi:hypothetical protein